MKTEASTWNKAEQQILYKAIRRLVGQRVTLPSKPPMANGLTWSEGPLTMDWVYADALNVRARRHGSEDNLRAGRMSRAKVAELFNWLQKRFPDEARVVENEIVRIHGTPTQNNWETLLRERGTFGGVKLRLHVPSKLSVRPLTTEERAERQHVSATIPLHQPFNFGIDETLPFLIGLQWVGGEWSALSLAASHLGCELSNREERRFLSQASFIEDAQAGLHRFAFVELQVEDGKKAERLLAVHGALSPQLLNDFARLLFHLPSESCKLHRLNVMFVLTPDGGLSLP